MIDLTGCIAIPLLKKSAFTGSYKGMRYRLKKETAPCGRSMSWTESRTA